MQHRFSKTIVIAMLVLATGGHWFLLQSIAWVGMAVSYSQADSLGVALKKTFDGEHRCKLCRLVESGKKAEQQPLKITCLKFDFAISEPCSLGLVRYHYPCVMAPPQARPERSDPPALPPPRALLALSA